MSLKRKEGSKNEKSLQKTIVAQAKRIEALEVKIKELNRYRNSFYTMPVPAVIYSTDGWVLASNRANEKLIGAKEEYLVQKFNMYQDKEAEEKGYLEGFKRAQKGESATMPDTSYKASSSGINGPVNENEVWTETTYAPLTDEKGNLEEILELSIDVTKKKEYEDEINNINKILKKNVDKQSYEIARSNQRLRKELDNQKRLEQEIRINEERFRMLFENSGEAVVVAENRCIVEANKAARELFQYSMDEVIGKPASMFHVSDKAYQIFGEKVYPGLTKEGNKKIVWKFKRKDGKEMTMDVTLSLSQNKVIIILRDITEKNSYEQRLKEKNEEIQAQNEELEESLQQLERLNIEIAESEKKYALLLNMIPEITVFLIDSSKRIVHTKLSERLKSERFNAANIMYEGVKEVNDDLGYKVIDLDLLNQTFKGKRFDFDMQIRENHFQVSYIPVGIGATIQYSYVVLFDITERIKQEFDVRENKKKYQNLFEKAPVGIITFNEKGDILECNQKFVDLLGSESIAFTKSVNLLSFPPIQKSGISADVKKCIETNEIITNELSYRSYWGKETFLRYTLNPLHTEKGNTKVYQAIAEDVTEYNKILESFKLSGRKYQFLAENTNDVISLSHIDGKLEYVSPSCFALTGYTSEELIEKNGLENIHPDDRERIVESIEKLRQGQKVLRIEYRLRRKDKKYIWVEASNKIISENDKTYILVSIRDIEERKKFEQALSKKNETILAQNEEIQSQNEELEEALSNRIEMNKKIKSSEKRYRLLFENMISGYALFEPVWDNRNKLVDSRFLDINPAFDKLTGFHEKEVIGKTAIEVLGEIETAWLQNFEKILKTGKPVSFIVHPGKINMHFEVHAFQPETNRFALILNDVSEKVNAEKNLRESEEMLRSLILASPDAITVTDMNGFIIFASDMVLETYGLKDKNDVIGKHVTEFIRSEDQELAITHINKIINKETFPKPKYYNLLRGDKSVFKGEISSTVFSDSSGKAKGMISITRDITHIIRAQEDLIKSEETIRNILKSSPYVIAYLSLEGKILDFNEAKIKTFGYASEELKQMNMDMLLGQSEKVQFKKDIKNVEKTGILKNRETRFITKSGQYFPAEYSLSVMKDANKKAIGLIIILQNIAKRKQAEQELIRNKAFLDNIIDNIPIGLLIFDIEGKMIRFNSAASKIAKFEKQTKKNDDISVFEHRLANKFQLNVLFEKAKNKITTRNRVQKVITKNNNNKLYINQHAFPIFDSKNHLIAVVCIMEDITKRVHAEKTAKEVEITKKSAKIKEQFVANVSHEIRTPLTGIIGMIDILERTPLNAEQKEYVNTIKSSSQILINLINDILDISKLEAGKMSISVSTFSLVNELNKIKGIFEANFSDKGIDLVFYMNKNLPAWIKADEKRLNQILINLISNAFKFTAKGHVKISAFVQKKLQNHKYLIRIEVEDTGIGIDANEQKGLFKKFSQVDSSLTKSIEGTGLGLSICKELVGLMKGEIGVESKKGEGSTFWFTFEAEESSNTDIFEEQSVNNSKLEVKDKFKKARVLLVEDKIVNQKVIKLMLTNIGCSVDIANNGKEAMEKFMPDFYNLIVMDIMMPIMDGITCVKNLRKQYKNLPPVIALSAHAMEGDAEKFIKEGMDDYLMKPVQQKDLFEKILQWCH